MKFDKLLQLAKEPAPVECPDMVLVYRRFSLLWWCYNTGPFGRWLTRLLFNYGSWQNRDNSNNVWRSND